MNELAVPAEAPSSPEEVLFEGHPAVVANVGALLACVLTLGLAYLYFLAKARAVRYRVTTERVVVETGLFGKRLDQIDIYRIHDYVVEQPFAQRLLGTGNVLLMTVDRTTPSIRLDRLKTDVVALYERLRKATEDSKRRRGVRVLDADR